MAKKTIYLRNFKYNVQIKFKSFFGGIYESFPKTQNEWRKWKLKQTVFHNFA